MSSSASNNEKLQVHSCEIDSEEGTDREEGAKIDSNEGNHTDRIVFFQIPKRKNLLLLLWMPVRAIHSPQPTRPRWLLVC